MTWNMKRGMAVASLCAATWSGTALAQAPPPRQPRIPAPPAPAPAPPPPGALAPAPAGAPGAPGGQAAPDQQADDARQPATGDLPGPIDSLQDLQDSGKMIYKAIDTNNDGLISQKEAIDAGNLAAGGFFFRADANGDGTLSKEEAKQARDNLLKQKPVLRAIITRVSNNKNNERGSNGGQNALAKDENILITLFDTNSDQQLQASELRKAVETSVQSVYDTADTNRDGQLSPVEVNAAMAGAVRTARQAAFQAADADHNGQISREEFDKAWAEPAHTVFAIVDANGDGQISQQEAQQAREVVLAQVRMLRVPEPANSPRNLIENGQKPDEVAPVPSFRRAAQQPDNQRSSSARTTSTAAPGR